MTLYQLWFVSFKSFIFVKNPDDTVAEYNGGPYLADRIVSSVEAKSYPMFKSVLEVTLED